MADATACNARPEVGLRVAVIDEAGKPLCDAKVTARDGSFSERLFGGECVFTGAVEREGTYTITAEAGGRRSEVPAVRVTPDGCTVGTTDVVVVLPD